MPRDSFHTLLARMSDPELPKPETRDEDERTPTQPNYSILEDEWSTEVFEWVELELGTIRIEKGEPPVRKAR